LLRWRVNQLAMRYTLAGILVLLFVASVQGMALAEEKIVLRFMSGFTEAQPVVYREVEQLLRLYEELNPHIVIEDLGRVASADELLLKTMAQTPPDVVKTDVPTIVSFTTMGILEPVPVSLEAVLKRNFYPVAVHALTINDSMMGVPIESNVTGIIYNTRLFAEAGIARPPATWEELDLIGPKLTRYEGNSIARAAISAGGTWDFDYFLMASLFGDGGTLVDEQGVLRVDEAPTYTTVERWTNALGVKRYMAFGHAAHFLKGEVAMYFGEPYWAQSLINNNVFHEMATTVMPKGTVSSGATYRNHGYAVPTSAKNKEEAWKLLEWLATRKIDGCTPIGRINSAMGSLPLERSDITSSFYAPIRDFMNGFIAASEFAVPNVTWLRFGANPRPLADAVKAIVNNGVAPQQAVKNAATAIAAGMEDFKKK
jgi:multiple sugar transport system substrate-binding protein